MYDHGMLRVKINSLRPSLTSYSKMQKCNNIQNNKKGEPNLKNAENCLDNGEHYMISYRMSLGNQKVHLLRVLYAKLFDKRDKKRH